MRLKLFFLIFLAVDWGQHRAPFGPYSLLKNPAYGLKGVEAAVKEITTDVKSKIINHKFISFDTPNSNQPTRKTLEIYNMKGRGSEVQPGETATDVKALNYAIKEKNGVTVEYINSNRVKVELDSKGLKKKFGKKFISGHLGNANAGTIGVDGNLKVITSSLNSKMYKKFEKPSKTFWEKAIKQKLIKENDKMLRQEFISGEHSTLSVTWEDPTTKQMVKRKIVLVEEMTLKVHFYSPDHLDVNGKKRLKDLFDTEMKKAGLKQLDDGGYGGTFTNSGKSKLKQKVDLVNHHKKEVDLDKIVARSSCRRAPGTRRRRDAHSRCAFLIDDDGKVKSVNTEELISIFKEADQADKKDIAKAVKENGDKIGPGEGDKSKLNKIVQHEELKTHAANVDHVTNVQSPFQAKKEGKVMERIKQNLADASAKVKLSTYKVSESISASINPKKQLPSSSGKASPSKSPKLDARLKTNSAPLPKGLRKANNIASSVNSAGSALGNFFLAKTVINGIKDGDGATLAIVGATAGFEYVSAGIAWAGPKLFGAASKVGKFSKWLGNAAGPIGAAADVGLSIYSLTQSIKRLSEATNEFDKADAIADIVGDSISIAVTTTVTAVSFIPGAAPIASAVGIVVELMKELVIGIFKANNEVRRIDSEVPLLDFEKRELFNSHFYNIFGTRSDNYLDYLVKEKKANDLEVSRQVDFLKNNTQFSGVIFPSKTLQYDGACSLFQQYCPVNMAFFCVGKSEKKLMKSGCDWNRPCPTKYLHCTDFTEKVKSSFLGWSLDAYYEYTCSCNDESKTTFGHSRSNSYVDLRHKRDVYLERAIPSDVSSTNFICKPGNSDHKGYKVSQMDSTWGYLCENAIGIEISGRKGQTLLINLENGTDTVYLDKKDFTPSLFIMGLGHKSLYGGGGKNTFLFEEGSCKVSGIISGGPDIQDEIVITDRCASGTRIEFKSGVMSGVGGERVRFSGIEQITGRAGDAESVVPECEFNSINLWGGSNYFKDKVKIPSSDCNWELSIPIKAHFELVSRAKKGNITIPINDASSFKDAIIELELDPESEVPSYNIIFFDSPPFLVTPVFVQIDNERIEVEILSLDTYDTLKLHLTLTSSPTEDWRFAVNFLESPTGIPLVNLLVSNKTEDPLIFRHPLPNISGRKYRRGSPSTPNSFVITGKDWEVKGGDKSDYFIVYENDLRLNGGGGEDTIYFNEKLFAPKLDLRGSSIENVYGVEGNPVDITTSCDTLFVDAKGGTTSQPDLIKIVDPLCQQRKLVVLAKKNTKVAIIGSKLVKASQADNINIIPLVFNSSVNDPFQFELEMDQEPFGNLFVSIHIQRKVWTAEEESSSVVLKGTSGEILKLPLWLGENCFLSHPLVLVTMRHEDEPQGQLILDEGDSVVKANYVLLSLPQTSAVFSGLTGIPNIFQVRNDSWNVAGVGKDDVFFLQSNVKKAVINATNSKHVLIVDDDIRKNKSFPDTYLVNLERGIAGQISLLNTDLNRINSVQTLLTRSGQPDIINVNCSTKSISSGGGHSTGHEDLIYISGKDCVSYNIPETNIITGNFTKVYNSAKHGVFVYNAEDLFTSEFFTIPGKENRHEFNFAFHPWNVIDKIGLQVMNETNLVFMLNNANHTLRKFKLSKYALGNEDSSLTEEYINPEFNFHIPGSSVTSNIKAFSDGVTTATHIISNGGLKPNETVVGLAVHVNHFILNVTEGTGGIVLGSSISSGNQFFLFNLNKLDRLDGGRYPNCTNYLQLGQNLWNGETISVNLSSFNDTGSMTVGEGTNKIVVIPEIYNIHNIKGRKGNSLDKVTASCTTQSISDIEDIIIKGVLRDPLSCLYNLTIQLGETTTVYFEESEWVDKWLDPEQDESSKTIPNGVNVFRYKFTQPRSFNVEGDEDSIIGGVHQYIFSFEIDELENLYFDFAEDTLHYSINGTEYSHEMLVAPKLDQYYLEPHMVTADGIEIKIGREGSVYLTTTNSGNFTVEEMSNEVIPWLSQIAQRLHITFIFHCENQFAFVGQRYLGGSRNVLQIVPYVKSHLGGAGAKDTIYEVFSLENNVYIYPGINVENISPDSDWKQTIDLTDVVVPLRLQLGTKYVPKVTQEDENLVIELSGYEDLPTGKIIIYGAASLIISERIQLLLHTSMMDLARFELEGGTRRKREIGHLQYEWELKPRAIQIPVGYVFSLSVADLEDNQEIVMENETDFFEEFDSIFEAAKDEDDLLLTDIISATENFKGDPMKRQITTVIISDFYRNLTIMNETGMPALLQGIRVKLPGMNLLLNEGEIKVVESSQSRNREDLSELSVTPWNILLHTAEMQILEEGDELDDFIEPMFINDEYDNPCPCATIDFTGRIAGRCNCPLLSMFGSTETNI